MKQSAARVRIPLQLPSGTFGSFLEEPQRSKRTKRVEPRRCRVIFSKKDHLEFRAQKMSSEHPPQVLSRPVTIASLFHVKRRVPGRYNCGSCGDFGSIQGGDLRRLCQECFLRHLARARARARVDGRSPPPRRPPWGAGSSPTAFSRGEGPRGGPRRPPRWWCVSADPQLYRPRALVVCDCFFFVCGRHEH